MNNIDIDILNLIRTELADILNNMDKTEILKEELFDNIWNKIEDSVLQELIKKEISKSDGIEHTYIWRGIFNKYNTAYKTLKEFISYNYNSTILEHFNKL